MKRYVMSLLLVVPFLMASQCTNVPGRYQLFMPPAGNPFLKPPEDSPARFLHRLDTTTGRIQLFKFEAESTNAEPYVEGPKTKACLEKRERERIQKEQNFALLSDQEKRNAKEKAAMEWLHGDANDILQTISACRALDSTGGEPSRPTGRYVMVEVPVVETERGTASR